MASIVLDDITSLSEALRAEYEKKEDGKYYLKLTGDHPEVKQLKAKAIEFRESNIKILKERDELDLRLKSFAGVDPDEYKKAKEKLATLEKKIADGDGGGGDGGDNRDFQVKLAEAIRAQVEPLTKKVTELTSEKEQADLSLKRRDLETSLRGVATKAGIADTAVDDFIGRGVKVFNLDGKAMKGDETIWSEKNPSDPMPMEEWADKLATEAPHLYKKNSGGGAGSDNQGSGTGGRSIASGDPIVFGENLEGIAKGDIKVDFGR